MSPTYSPTPTSPTYVALCAHTHLFPGARCRVRALPDPRVFASAPEPIGLALRFSDGVIVEAEVLVADDGAGEGEAVLSVAPYTTGAGSHITERVWPVRKLRPSGGEVELTVGNRSPWEPADPGES